MPGEQSAAPRGRIVGVHGESTDDADAETTAGGDPSEPRPLRADEVTATDTVSADGVRIRLRPWRGRPDTAECQVTPAGAVVPADLVRSALDAAREHGYHTAVTPALPPFEWRPYVDTGFEIRERLRLLAHDLLDIAPRTDHRLRRATRRDTGRLLEVDNAAFQPFWRLDEDGLDEAVRATPTARLRVDRDLVGYALVGRAGQRGYIQRLAVHPREQGHGLGRALVIDGLWWLRRWRGREALVNTQEDNAPAVHLYEQLGFRHRPGGLAVLQADLTAST